MIVLNHNLLEIPATEIHMTKVQKTTLSRVRSFTRMATDQNWFALESHSPSSLLLADSSPSGNAEILVLSGWSR